MNRPTPEDLAEPRAELATMPTLTPAPTPAPEDLSALVPSPNPFFIWAFPSDIYPEGSGVWCIPFWGLRGPGFRTGAPLRGAQDPARGLRWQGPPRCVWAFPTPEAAAVAAASESEARGRAYRRWAECVVLEVELLSFGELNCDDGRVIAPFLRVVAPRAYAAALVEEGLSGAQAGWPAPFCAKNGGAARRRARPGSPTPRPMPLAIAFFALALAIAIIAPALALEFALAITILTPALALEFALAIAIAIAIAPALAIEFAAFQEQPGAPQQMLLLRAGAGVGEKVGDKLGATVVAAYHPGFKLERLGAVFQFAGAPE